MNTFKSLLIAGLLWTVAVVSFAQPPSAPVVPPHPAAMHAHRHHHHHHRHRHHHRHHRHHVAPAVR